MSQLSGNETESELASVIRRGEDVTLTRAALKQYLGRYAEGALATAQLGEIADLLEFENVLYEAPYQRTLATIVSELASPEINGLPTEARIKSYLSKLR